MSSGKWLNLAKLQCPTIQNEKNNSFFTGLLLRWASQVVLVVKNPPANAGDGGFNPWIGKIPWRRVWQHTSVFLPGESHGQRSLVGYSP